MEDTELDLNSPLNFRLLIVAIMILFFVSGTVVGVLWGGHIVQTEWEDFYEQECEDKEEMEWGEYIEVIGSSGE